VACANLRYINVFNNNNNNNNIGHVWRAQRLDAAIVQFRIGQSNEAPVPNTSTIRLAVSTQYGLVTDGRTDRRTHDDGIYRTSIASRGKVGSSYQQSSRQRYVYGPRHALT